MDKQEGAGLRQVAPGVFLLAVPCTGNRFSAAHEPMQQPPPDPEPAVTAGADATEAAAVQSSQDRQRAALDGMQRELAQEARGYARRIQLLLRLSRENNRYAILEMAGSWHVSQLTAGAWTADAERYETCLPIALGLLDAGLLSVTHAKVLLHGTRNCTEDVARAVEAEVLPAGAKLCPTDLRKRVDRAVLRIESEQQDSAAAEQRHARAVAGRRTFAKPGPDGMGLAGAVLTAEQLVCWQHGMDLLERRERAADRDAGVERSSQQRRADLFAALPSLVLAGTAQDRSAGAAGDCPCGRTVDTGCCLAAVLGVSPSAAAQTIPALPPATTGGAPADGYAAEAGQPAAASEADVDADAPDVATATDAAALGTAVDTVTAVAGGPPSAPAALAGAAAGHPLTAPATPLPAPTPSSAPSPGPLMPWTLDHAQVAATITVNVHVPMATVLDLSREPGTVDRYGPVSAEHVRLLRPRQYRRVLVDGDTGVPIAVDDRTVTVASDPTGRREQLLAMLRVEVVTDRDQPQHDPSASLARIVDIRDVHCCGPGCSATRTDRDHLVPYPAGPTNARNMGRLSPRCHHAKHDGWTLLRHPDGSTTWISPLGRSYHRPGPHSPPPRVSDWEAGQVRPEPHFPAEHDDESWTDATPPPAPKSEAPPRQDDDEEPPF